jgi:Flp pilus assembly protein TadB
VTSTSAASRVRHWVAAAVAVLLVAAAALLVVGILLERHTEPGAEHPIVTSTTEQQQSHHDESTEGGHAESGITNDSGGEAAERLTGISAESPWIVTLGAVVSVALAVAVWLRPNRLVIVTVVVFTAAALVLDVLEINYQLGADRIGLAALAGVIAALRVATIIGSGYLYQSHHPAAT